MSLSDWTRTMPRPPWPQGSRNSNPKVDAKALKAAQIAYAMVAQQGDEGGSQASSDSDSNQASKAGDSQPGESATVWETPAGSDTGRSAVDHASVKEETACGVGGQMSTRYSKTDISVDECEA